MDSKFKIGDRVIITSDRLYKGLIGTVTHILNHPQEFIVAFSSKDITNLPAGMFYESELLKLNAISKILYAN